MNHTTNTGHLQWRPDVQRGRVGDAAPPASRGISQRTSVRRRRPQSPPLALGTTPDRERAVRHLQSTDQAKEWTAFAQVARAHTPRPSLSATASTPIFSSRDLMAGLRIAMPYPLNALIVPAEAQAATNR